MDSNQEVQNRELLRNQMSALDSQQAASITGFNTFLQDELSQRDDDNKISLLVQSNKILEEILQKEQSSKELHFKEMLIKTLIYLGAIEILKRRILQERILEFIKELEADFQKMILRIRNEQAAWELSVAEHQQLMQARNRAENTMLLRLTIGGSREERRQLIRNIIAAANEDFMESAGFNEKQKNDFQTMTNETREKFAESATDLADSLSELEELDDIESFESEQEIEDAFNNKKLEAKKRATLMLDDEEAMHQNAERCISQISEPAKVSNNLELYKQKVRGLGMKIIESLTTSAEKIQQQILGHTSSGPETLGARKSISHDESLPEATATRGRSPAIVTDPGHQRKLERQQADKAIDKYIEHRKTLAIIKHKHTFAERNKPKSLRRERSQMTVDIKKSRVLKTIEKKYANLGSPKQNSVTPKSLRDERKEKIAQRPTNLRKPAQQQIPETHNSREQALTQSRDAYVDSTRIRAPAITSEGIENSRTNLTQQRAAMAPNPTKPGAPMITAFNEKVKKAPTLSENQTGLRPSIPIKQQAEQRIEREQQETAPQAPKPSEKEKPIHRVKAVKFQDEELSTPKKNKDHEPSQRTKKEKSNRPTPPKPVG